MKRIWKRTAAFLAAAMMCAGMVMTTPVTVEAAARLKKVEYDGKGEVDIDFYGRVQYKNVKITVKDQDGKSYKAVITDRDSDDLEFRIKNYKTAKTYTFTISGIKQSGEKKFGKLKGKVTIPGSAGWVKKGGKKCYVYGNGKKATGITRIGNQYYFFDKNGKMITGWKKYDGDWYYMKKNGVMAREEWLKIGSKFYYFDDDGECENRK